MGFKLATRSIISVCSPTKHEIQITVCSTKNKKLSYCTGTTWCNCQ